MSKERQIATDLSGIRLDHIHRYLWALPGAKSPVLDVACGIGYGAYIFAQHGHEVTAVDIDPNTIRFGQTYWGHGNIHWITADVATAPWGWTTFKTAICYEAIEHLPDPIKVLTSICDALDGDGRLYCSVPNEEQYPFKPENFLDDEYPHLRHYTPQEFDALLGQAGFQVIHRGTQLTKTSSVVNGSGGMFLVYTAMKKPYQALAA